MKRSSVIDLSCEPKRLRLADILPPNAPMPVLIPTLKAFDDSEQTAKRIGSLTQQRRFNEAIAIARGLNVCRLESRLRATTMLYLAMAFTMTGRYRHTVECCSRALIFVQKHSSKWVAFKL